jgi:hypothetical protein
VYSLVQLGPNKNEEKALALPELTSRFRDFSYFIDQARNSLKKYIFRFKVNPDIKPEKKRKFHFEVQKY